MERLTYRTIDGHALLLHGVAAIWKKADPGKYAVLDNAVDRLAAYEDTGLEPEQVVELKSFIQGGIHKVDDGWKHVQDLLQAERDGKLVAIPWAAGDVIYEADPAHGVVKHTFAGEPAWMMHSYAVDDAGNEWYDGWGSSDETPFYKTREEAEAALKGGEG